jgi:hypothetical protein
MADIIHDPKTDWCACEPGGDDRCSYRLLADAVDEHLNPKDADEAEEAIVIGAVERAAAYIRSQPCTCTEQMIADWEPCPRCEALGLIGGKAWQAIHG